MGGEFLVSLLRCLGFLKTQRWKTSSAPSPCFSYNVVNVFTCLCRLWARLIWKLAPGFCSSSPELHEYLWTDLLNCMAAMDLRDSPLSPGALRIPYRGLTLGKYWCYDAPYRKFYFLSHKTVSFKSAIVVYAICNMLLWIQTLAQVVSSKMIWIPESWALKSGIPPKLNCL